jgi:hypothetical protein
LSTRSGEPPEPGSDGPEVILDVVFEEGLFFLAIANTGNRPALKVSCRFDEPFSGLGGTKDVSRLPLLRNIEFLAPRKQVRTLLDASASYFARGEPTKLSATVSFRDERGVRSEKRVVHDLAIYREIAYPVRDSRR